MNIEGIQVDEKLIEAFHLMYDNYPEAAQLTHESKRIVALNPACEARGRHIGMVCALDGSPESHKGCLAAKAIAEQKRQWVLTEEADGQKVPVLWLPVPGYPDFYVHFTAGKLEYYK